MTVTIIIYLPTKNKTRIVTIDIRYQTSGIAFIVVSLLNSGVKPRKNTIK